MRKKNGYTFIDILVVIIALGLVTLFTVPKLSHAFENNKDTLYDESLELYLNQATKYGNTIKNEGYIGSTNGDVTDIRDGSSMLNMKFHLIYDEEKDEVYAEVV